MVTVQRKTYNGEIKTFEFYPATYNFKVINPYYKKRIVFIDCETTGLEEDDRIIEIGLVEMYENNITGREFHSYFNPHKPSTNSAFSIHGLSEKFLSDKPDFSSKSEDILRFIENSILVGHNIEFDLRFLYQELKRIDSKYVPSWKSVCTMNLATPLYSKRPKLDQLIERYLINKDRKTHSAIDDARIVSMIYPRLIKEIKSYTYKVVFLAEPLKINIFLETIDKKTRFRHENYLNLLGDVIDVTCIVEAISHSVIRNPWSVKYMEEDEISKIMAVPIATYEWENIFDYLPKTFHTPELCWMTLRRFPENIGLIENQTEEMCNFAVKKSGLSISGVKNQTQELCNLAISNNPIAIRYIHNQTPELCLSAVKSLPSTIRYINNQTEELCRIALKDNGNNLEYIKVQNEELCEIAVRNTPNSLKYIKDNTLKAKIKKNILPNIPYKEFSCNQPQYATFRKPNYFIFKSKKFIANNYTKILTTTIKELYNINKDLIEYTAINKTKFKSDPHLPPYWILLSYSIDDIKGKHKLEGTDIYISTGFRSDETIYIIGQLLDLFNITHDNFIISAR